MTGCSLFSPVAPPPPAKPVVQAEKKSITDAQLRRLLKAERIVIEKSTRTMTVYALNKPIATYKVALGRGLPGPKTCEGDYRTPEGTYTITDFKQPSRFHLALRFSYPNKNDIARAKAKGCPPGGNLLIHGLGADRAPMGRAHSSVDWTDGCIAVTDQEIEQLWRMVVKGTVVEIRP